MLSGQPALQVGAAAPSEVQSDGAVVWHASNVSHAIRTNDLPMFTIFGRHGAIGEPSWYRDDMRNETLPVRRPTIAKG